jgi:ABC-type bacteriocin/lantibiotic exporter with double-glycine peptidase domain
MKQRAKYYLAFAEFDQSSQKPNLTLFDEPHANLDTVGISKVQNRMKEISKHCYTIIASNDPEEYSSVDKIIKV